MQPAVPRPVLLKITAAFSGVCLDEWQELPPEPLEWDTCGEETHLVRWVDRVKLDFWEVGGKDKRRLILSKQLKPDPNRTILASRYPEVLLRRETPIRLHPTLGNVWLDHSQIQTVTICKGLLMISGNEFVGWNRQFEKYTELDDARWYVFGDVLPELDPGILTPPHELGCDWLELLREWRFVRYHSTCPRAKCLPAEIGFDSQDEYLSWVCAMPEYRIRQLAISPRNQEWLIRRRTT